jgi:AcrR family transcriptional regulator
MTTRPYDMTARARAAEQTRVRIIEAAVTQFMHSDLSGMTLEAVAREAGVTLQTVLRHFGSKGGLVSAAVEHKTAEVLRMRTPPGPHDRAAAVHTLISSYETMGDLNWRMLCHEEHEPTLHEALERARAVHRAWLEQVFSEVLPVHGPERARRLELLFGASDFYLWKLWRRDLGMSRQRTERRMNELLDAVLQGFAPVEET